MSIKTPVAALRDWVESRYIALIMASLALGLLAPSVFTGLEGLTSLILMVNMFTLALGCTAAEFIAVMRTPLKVLLTVLFLYGVIPVLAFGWGRMIFPGDPQLVAGMVLIAVLPVAMTSAFWTDLTKGNLPLTLSIITFTTFLAGIITPGVMSLVAGKLIEFDAMSLVIKLVKTVIIPTIVGIVVREKFPKQTGAAKPYLNLGVRLNIFLILAINAAVMRPFLGDVGPKVLLIIFAVLVQVLLSYLGGYGFAYLLFPKDAGSRVSISYVSGMRNNGAGIVIALAYFPPLVAMPVILSILLQQPLASVFRTLVLRNANSEGAAVTG